MRLWWTLAAGVIGVAVLGCAQDRAVEAVIIPSGAYSRNGVAASDALSVKDRAFLRQLESYFPGYRGMPGSGLSGSWMSGYDVYVVDGSNRTVHIVVSRGSEFWNVGKG